MASSTNGGIKQRVWMHYKALKYASPFEWVWTKKCGWVNPCTYTPHGHGYWKTTTSNSIWLTLARVHKMPVREIKDIINERRNNG